MPPKNPRVFISYSHDDAAHCDRVLALAQQLRRDGINAELDQFHQDELQHWPSWCEEQMRPENADFVLCVCTAEYRKRVENRAEADVGKGVFWEGRRVYNEIYRNKGNRRFVPVLPTTARDDDIPEVLDGYTWFRLDKLGLADAESGYAKLYRLLTRQPGVSGAALGGLVQLPPLPEAERVTDFIALVAAGLGRIETVQHQHTGRLEQIKTGQQTQAETQEKLWQWLKRWRGWLFAALLVLAGLGGLAWVMLPQQTAQAVAYQFSGKATAARLRDEIEQRFQKDLAAAHQASKHWKAIRELEKNRDAALGRVDDIVAFIEQGLAGSPDPIFQEASRLLELQGSDAALGYLESRRADSLAHADQLAQQAEAAQEKLHASLRPLLLEAELRQGRQEWDAALKLLQTVADKAPQWWKARTRLGNQLRELARYAEAEPHLRAAAALTVDEKDQAVALNNLATLMYATNRLAEAEPLMRQALAIFEKIYGQENFYVVLGINNLAQLLNTTNRLADAEPLMRRALAIVEKSHGPEHPDVAIHLNNLANLLQDTNRVAEVEPLMRRALAIDEKSHGPDHLDVARDLNNLATLLYDTNRLAEAEPLMRRALAINEKSYGPEHPDVAIRLNNLAQLLYATNRLAEAEPLMRRALAIDEKSYGPEHPNVAVRLESLAGLFQATNRLAEAEPLFRRALAIDEKSYGPEHPAVARDLVNLATLMTATNRLTDAEPLMRQALAIDEKSYGPEHPMVATHLNNLAQLLYAANRLAEAEPLMRRALAINEKSYGPEHSDVAIDLNNLARLLQATNRLAEAEPLMRRMVVIFLKFTRATSHEHPHLRAAIGNYQQLLKAQRLKPAQITQRLAALGPEAGYDAENWRRLQGQLGQ